MIPTDILNYRVVRLLGSGGMGSVYLAVNTSIDQQVAIKVLRPELAKNPELRAKFKQEAELLCSFDHPGIVKFINYVERPDGIFLIMEYVKGITLEDFINKKNGLIVESKAYPIIKEILEAFEYAHSKGIVHRDIKPANIIIQDDGHIKIMDFGIAQIVSEAESTTKEMGTPVYMSPEQIYGKSADVRSDIYSLGVLIHNMLTGKAPYDATRLTQHEIKQKVVKDTLPKMTEYYPYISDKIQKVVDKATQKVPEARYQSCSEMKAAVKKAIAPDPIPKWLLYGGIAFIAACLITGFCFWDYYRLKVDYYQDYVEVYGVPRGIGKLSSNDVKHREASYRFESSKGKVRRVSYVNSKRKLTDHHDSEDKERIVDMVVTYAEGNGKVDTEKFMDRNGKVLYVKDFDSNLKTVTFKLDDELGSEMTLNSQTELNESVFDILAGSKSKISKYILDFDENGYLAKVEYAGFGNVRVPDGQGIFGRSYKHDKKGRVIEESFLGKDGSLKSTQFGLGKKRFKYDSDGNLEEITYLTVDDKPSSDGNNCPVVKLTYDKWGNRTSEKYYDMDGNPMLRKDNGVAGFIYLYDNNGQCTKATFIGIDGGATYYNGVSGFINEYDENGYLTSRNFIDASGAAAVINEDYDFGSGMTTVSYNRMELKNDDKGNVLEFVIKTLDGKVVDTPGIARKTCTYDSLGNILSEIYLDENGKIYAPAAIGNAGIEYQYNPQGRLSRLTYLDTSKKPLTLSDRHYAYLTYDYDVRGNMTRRSYFDANGKPAITDEGISAVIYEYDENGNEKSRQFLDAKGKPCVLNWYCSRLEWDYDDQGRKIKEKYLNAEEKPMAINGIAVIEKKYDERDNITSIKKLGLNGSLASGFNEERHKYDNRDNIIEIAYFGNSGQPVNCSEGYHRQTMQYNSANQNTELRYYDTKGNLRNVAGQKYAIVKREYDARGNKISEIFFDANGNRGTDASKVHKYYNQYDRVSNKLSHQISFGADGKPIIVNNVAAEGRMLYDKRGKMVKLLAYDGYGKKTTGLNGWHEQRFDYNDSGDLISEAYYSIDGKPVNDKASGCHKVVYTYNKMRMKESESYFDKNGKPALTSDGYSIMKIKYNNQNQPTEVAYFGVNGKPVEVNGAHRFTYTYKNGVEYKLEFFNSANRKIGEAIRVNNSWKVKTPLNGDNIAPPGWRELWQEMARNCPADNGDGIVLGKISIGNDKIVISLSLENELNNAESVKDELASYFRKITGTPSYVDIIIDINVNEKKLIIN